MSNQRLEIENDKVKITIIGSQIQITNKETDELVSVYFGRVYRNFTAWLKKGTEKMPVSTFRY